VLFARQAARAAAPGTQFTCFTSNTVQILTQKFQPEVRIFKSGKKDAGAAPGSQFTCFTGTKAQILTMRKRQGMWGRCYTTPTRCRCSDFCVSMCTMVLVKQVN
jgi:hypothetical protein